MLALIFIQLVWNKLKNLRSLTFAKNNFEINVKERVLFNNYKERFERSLHLWFRCNAELQIKRSTIPSSVNGSVTLYRLYSNVQRQRLIATQTMDWTGTWRLWLSWTFP